MAEIIKRNKALSVSPLKASQTVGAALAFLGFSRAIPMLHGSQGCSAFGKIFFVRHFREPIPLQTTAMDQVSTIMGSEESIIEGLKNICEKMDRPDLIGVPTTGLTETQGSDVAMAVKGFRQQYPEYNGVHVVPVSTPDFSGCMESGFARAVVAIIETLVPQSDSSVVRMRHESLQVNVLAGSSLTPGDLEEIKVLIESFGLRPMVIPDIADSLDGHLIDAEFTPLTLGGAPVSALNSLGDAAATLVIGPSMYKAADVLQQKTGVMDYRFDHLLGMDAVDDLVDTLHRISGKAVPQRIERQRAQLQDAMLDTHFMLGMARFAIAAEPDLLNGLSQMLAGVGAETVAAVSPINAPVLKHVATSQVKIGDLQDLEKLATEAQAEVVIGNSHAVESAARLGMPLMRAGFPQYDQVGGYQRTWVGYRGSRQTLFELANMLLALEKGEIHPYHSIYSTKHITQEHSHGTPAKAVAVG